MPLHAASFRASAKSLERDDHCSIQEAPNNFKIWTKSIDPTSTKPVAKLCRVMSEVRRGSQKKKRIDEMLQPKSLHEMRPTTLRTAHHEHRSHKRPRAPEPVHDQVPVPTDAGSESLLSMFCSDCSCALC